LAFSMKYVWITLIAVFIGVAIPVLNMAENWPVLALLVVSVGFFSWLFSDYVVRFDKMAMFILGATCFPHAIMIGGFNVSVVDVYTILAAGALIVTSRMKIHFPGKFMILSGSYVLLGFIGILWANNIKELIPPLIQFIQWILMGIPIFYNMKNEMSIVKVINLYIASASLIAFMAMGIVAATGYNGALFVLGLQKNALGTVVGNAVPLTFAMFLLTDKSRKMMRRVYMICLLSNALILILSLSRGSMLGAIVGTLLITYFIGRLKQTLIIMASTITVIVGTIVVVAPDYAASFVRFDDTSSAFSRVLIYDDVFEKIRAKPILGHGMGQYEIWLPQINFRQDDPNNVFLLNMVEMGVVGLTLFVLMMLYIVVVAFRNKKLFKDDRKFTLLNAMAFATFMSQLTHIQVDVSWVRGVGQFFFAMVAIVLVLPRFWYMRNGGMPVKDPVEKMVKHGGRGLKNEVAAGVARGRRDGVLEAN